VFLALLAQWSPFCSITASQPARQRGGARRQAHLLQATLNSIRDGVAAFDAKGNLTASTPIFSSLPIFPTYSRARGRAAFALHEMDSQRARRCSATS